MHARQIFRCNGIRINPVHRNASASPCDRVRTRLKEIWGHGRPRPSRMRAGFQRPVKICAGARRLQILSFFYKLLHMCSVRVVPRRKRNIHARVVDYAANLSNKLLQIGSRNNPQIKCRLGDPGITFPRNPAFRNTGAKVFRIIACSNTFLLISRSASLNRL